MSSEAEPQPVDTVPDDSDEDDAEEASETGSQGSGAASAGKKKKKKNRKKKKASGSAENGGDHGAVPPAVAAAASPASTAPSSTNGSTNKGQPSKAEQDKKFNKALADIRAGDDMWITCNAVALQDAKAKKLLEQLKSNSTVTSLDLSQNSLSDEGAQAIAAILASPSAAPELIELDLRENSFTPQGLTVLEGLGKVRKQLAVKTGSMAPPEPPPSAAGSDKAAGSGAAAGGKGAATKEGLGFSTDNKLIRKYFQIGNALEEEDHPPTHLADAGIDPAKLWQKLSEAVDAGTAGISAALPLLQQLCSLLSQEATTLEPHMDAMSGHRPHTKTCLEHLHTLEDMLQLVPSHVTVQYSRSPQPAVGSHRVWAAEVIAQLLGAHHPVIDRLIAAAGFVPRILHLALTHPVCSALHARALRVLKSCMLSSTADLLGPVLCIPGWGHKLPAGRIQPPASASQDSIEDEGSSSLGSSLDGSPSTGAAPAADRPEQQQQLCLPLPAWLAHLGHAAVDKVSGQRSPLAGFVIEASKILVLAEDSDDDDSSEGEAAKDAGSKAGAAADSSSRAEPCLPMMRRALASQSAWSEFTDSDGVFKRLVTEQQGDLGGPRAVRNTMMGNGGMMDGMSAELAELAGGGMIGGHELLALLSGMSMGSS